MHSFIFVALIALFAVACGDAESKDGNTTTTNNASADAGTDMASADAGVEPFGTVCDGPDGELLNQECSVVDQECEEGICEKRIILDDMQMPSGFAIVCGGEAIETTLTEGDACGVGVGDCPANMICKLFAGESESICRKWCRLDDAYGCSPEQACVPSSDLEPVFGVCADACPAG